ncbi:MAG: DUF134 domain-containing protein [Candidatus Bathyarchaeota archaeon]|nr:DUF134 domain-containing protein [Candidatus Bathyarchaeota archaeon]
MRGRRRRGRQGRMPRPVIINHISIIKSFKPEPREFGDPIFLEPAELEVLRLIDLENLSQEEAGVKMGVSRGTIWRLQKRGRAKVVMALVEGRRLVISDHMPVV